MRLVLFHWQLRVRSATGRAAARRRAVADLSNRTRRAATVRCRRMHPSPGAVLTRRWPSAMPTGARILVLQVRDCSRRPRLTMRRRRYLDAKHRPPACSAKTAAPLAAAALAHVCTDAVGPDGPTTARVRGRVLQAAEVGDVCGKCRRPQWHSSWPKWDRPKRDRPKRDRPLEAGSAQVGSAQAGSGCGMSRYACTRPSTHALAFKCHVRVHACLKWAHPRGPARSFAHSPPCTPAQRNHVGASNDVLGAAAALDAHLSE